MNKQSQSIWFVILLGVLASCADPTLSLSIDGASTSLTSSPSTSMVDSNSVNPTSSTMSSENVANSQSSQGNSQSSTGISSTNQGTGSASSTSSGGSTSTTPPSFSSTSTSTSSTSTSMTPASTSSTSSSQQTTSGMIQTDLGFLASSALSANGRLFMWGRNSNGQVGDGSTTERKTPVEITSRFTLTGDEKIIQVRLGNNHSAALTSSGRVWTWGLNNYGQLGDNSTTNRSVPTDITNHFNLVSGEKVISLALSKAIDGWQTAAYTSTGRVFMWGWNFWGQLGDGTKVNRTVPTDITAAFAFQTNETIVDLQLGNNHQLLVTSFGRVMAWGLNLNGQLGDGTTTTRMSPVEISTQFNLVGEEKIRSIRLGVNYSSAVTSTHRVFLWGGSATELNAFGMTNGQITPFDATSGFSLSSNDYASHVRVGYNHAGVLTTNGQVWLWGNNDNGKIGNNSTALQSAPINITANFNLPSNERIVTLELGVNHSSATTNLGRLFMWGRNSANGTTADALLPFVLNTI